MWWAICTPLFPDSVQAQELEPEPGHVAALKFLPNYELRIYNNVEPTLYHWPWHHRIYTTTLLLKLGNFLLSRSLEEFAYWFRSYLVPIPSAMYRTPSPKSCLLCSLLHSRVWFCCSICKPLFLACLHLSMSFLMPDTVMLYQFNIPKPLVMWLCQVCLIFLFI